MSHDDVAAHLAGGLPAYYPSSPSEDNYTLLEAIGDELEQQDDEIQAVYDAGLVQRADSIDQLTELGRLIDVLPRTSEALETYRARLLAEYSTITGKATIRELLETAARILDVSESAIGFTEPAGGERGTAQITFPGRALDDLAFNDSELADILDRTIPAGYRLDALRGGTFTYITPTDYNDGSHDASLGYDGLDANGNPKDNGGTYAGVLQ